SERPRRGGRRRTRLRRAGRRRLLDSASARARRRFLGFARACRSRQARCVPGAVTTCGAREKRCNEAHTSVGGGLPKVFAFRHEPRRRASRSGPLPVRGGGPRLAGGMLGCFGKTKKSKRTAPISSIENRFTTTSPSPRGRS